MILKNVVPQAMVDAAHARIESRREGENLAKAREMTDLVNSTAVTPILNDAMGRFDPLIASQVAVIPKSKPGGRFNNVGYVGTCPTTVRRPMSPAASRCRRRRKSSKART